MFKNHRSANKVIALIVFLCALGLYFYTMAPTASFWDPGEFIASAHGLEVGHPPGSPLFQLIGRLFSMFMPAGMVAASINFVSVLASALVIMLLYLSIVRLVREFKGYDVSQYEPIDRISMYGGAVIGAFGFAVTDSFWFNAVEAEVYALSMFFTAMVVWLALKWAENHEEPGNERWLMLIFYMFGLASGVHLLSLLAIFFVGLIVYFKKKEFGLLSLCAAGVVTVFSFLVIYPFTLKTLPGIAKGVKDATYGLIGPAVFILIIFVVLAIAIYYTHKNRYYWANFLLLAYTMILIGFSSYALIFIRSQANPPIDENDPDTVQSFINYMGRKQYGHTPLLWGRDYNNETGRLSNQEKFLPRRYSFQHLQQYSKYNSDWDFFWNYQVKQMYIRYFAWNFIGRTSDIQNTGWQAGFSKSHYHNNPAHNSYFYLPFLLGLFGMLYHFQRDWKRASSVLVLFIMTGAAIIIYLNQTPMQPRERDYAYVGSFFAFAIWMGIGGVGLIDMAKEYLGSTNKAVSRAVSYGILGVLFLGVPFLMGFQNFNDHNRHKRYVASDYAYNLLQSVDYEGILFTNGDNDTFPLWYAQEVEGVRTDVRVVNLSLLNTAWYIKQMRDEWSHESAPLPISFTNKRIKKMTSQLEIHQPDTITIPVNKKLLKNAFSESNRYREAIGVKAGTPQKVYHPKVDFGIPIDSLDNKVSWYYKGRSAGEDRQGNKRYYMQVSDKVVLNILKNNHWLRPVYFANTVSRPSQLGLQHYFRYEGMAARIVPKYRKDISIFGYLNPHIMADKLSKFRFRHWKGIYLNSYIRRMMPDYYIGVKELADTYIEKDKPDSADKWLQWGEKNLPFYPKIGQNRALFTYAYTYARAGDLKNALRMGEEGKKPVIEDLKHYFNQYDDLRSKVLRLKDEAKQARSNANVGKQQELQTKAAHLISGRQNIIQHMYSAAHNLVILQHIYYMADKDDKAKALTSKVNTITNKRIKFPQNKKESNEIMSKLYQ